MKKDFLREIQILEFILEKINRVATYKVKVSIKIYDNMKKVK